MERTSESESPQPLVGENETRLNQNEDEAINRSSIQIQAPNLMGGRSCDDWLCAICMDYLIDAVQTGCRHKFCKFCINRWINVNPGRRCPICRGGIGAMYSLPELDRTIANSLQTSLTSEELLQRHSVRIQRETNRTTASSLSASAEIDGYFDAHELLSLENQLVSTALQNSLQAVEHEFNFRNGQLLESLNARPVQDTLFQSHDNPWTAQSTANIVHRMRQSVHQLYQAPPTSLHLIQMAAENYGRTVEQAGMPARNETLRRRNRSLDRRDSGVSVVSQSSHRMHFNNNRHHGRRQAHMRAIAEDNLVEEYNYRLRRIESAYSRIQEAQRDHDYHSDEMINIYNEFVSIQTGHMDEFTNRNGHDMNDANTARFHRGRGRRRIAPSLRSSGTNDSAGNDETDSGSGNTHNQTSRLRRRSSRWHMHNEGHPHNNHNISHWQHLPHNLRSRINERRQQNHRLDTTSAVESDPSTTLLTARTLSESEEGRNSQSLRITREEVNLPQHQESQRESFRSLLSSAASSCRSPLRSWSESTRGNRTDVNTTPLTSRNRQVRRRSVQFQAQRDMDSNPDHEVSTPTTATSGNSQQSLPRRNFGINYECPSGPSINTLIHEDINCNEIAPATTTTDHSDSHTSISIQLLDTLNNNSNSPPISQSTMTNPRRRHFNKIDL